MSAAYPQVARKGRPCPPAAPNPGTLAVDITTALEGLTERTRAYRTHRRMARLADTLRKAAAARDLLETAVEADVASYIERVNQVHKRREDVFMRKHGELDMAVADLADFEKDLEDFGKNEPGAYRGTGQGS